MGSVYAPEESLLNYFCSMKVACYSKTTDEINMTLIRNMVTLLQKEGAQVFLPAIFEGLPIFKGHGVQFYDHHSHLKGIEFMLSIGGDGTFLDTVGLIRDQGIPVLGFNTGRMGFLAIINKDETEQAIKNLMKGQYEIEERSLLQFECEEQIFEEDYLALNDFVVQKNDSSSMITVHTYLNGEFLNTYWADGVIIATATGSTGYSLSGGGPILFPGSENFVITPISPHNLSMRPVVIPDNQVITFEVESRSHSCRLSLDSRSVSVPNSLSFGVRKADFTLKVVKMNQRDYLETLRRKLDWGLDRRN